jgi:hypothetical protein
MGMLSRQLQQLEGGCDQCWDCLRTKPKIGQEPNLAMDLDPALELDPTSFPECGSS